MATLLAAPDSVASTTTVPFASDAAGAKRTFITNPVLGDNYH